MTEGVKQAFLLQKEYLDDTGIQCKSHIDGYSDFIFINRFGEVQQQSTLNKALQRIIRDCNYEVLENHVGKSDPVLLPHFSCHVLRHTFATRAFESGASLKLTQQLLGHADVTTTLSVYVHLSEEIKKKGMTALEAYLDAGVQVKVG